MHNSPVILNDIWNPLLKEKATMNIEHQRQFFECIQSDDQSSNKKRSCIVMAQPVSNSEKLDKDLDDWRTGGRIVRESDIGALNDESKSLNV